MAVEFVPSATARMTQSACALLLGQECVHALVPTARAVDVTAGPVHNAVHNSVSDFA